MKQTGQYGLNQWDLSDRIRMEDFNADNFKIAAALAGLDARADGLGGQVSGLDSQITTLGGQITTLDGQVSGLGEQLSALGGTVAGLPTSASLEKLKATLQNADTNLQNTKLGWSHIALPRGKGFVPAPDKSCYLFDMTDHPFGSYGALCVSVYLVSPDSDTYYLNAQTGIGLIGNCIYTQGTSVRGMAVLVPGFTYHLIFFPMKYAAHSMGLVFTGKYSGVGDGHCYYSQASGLTLTPASGKVVSSTEFTVTLYGLL